MISEINQKILYYSLTFHSSKIKKKKHKIKEIRTN